MTSAAEIAVTANATIAEHKPTRFNDFWNRANDKAHGKVMLANEKCKFDIAFDTPIIEVKFVLTYLVYIPRGNYWTNTSSQLIKPKLLKAVWGLRFRKGIDHTA